MSEGEHRQALPAGHELHGYRLLRVLGAGGFGITYLAEHVKLNETRALKEYLPNELAVREGASVHPKSASDRADFEWGLERFLEEARTLTRFEHPNLVRVRDFFDANGTAYLAMDYEDGESLDRLLKAAGGTLSEAQLRRVVLPIAAGLAEVHAAGVLHRDVKPSNVYVRRRDETPVLLDFGAARQALGGRSRSMTAVVTPGYSPPEQYESGGAGQGPWTDVYALSALCHRAITGKTPPEATRRQNEVLRKRPDPLPRLADAAPKGYAGALLEAVDRGLELIETERPQSVAEWLARIDGRIDGEEAREAGEAPPGPAPRAAPPASGGRRRRWPLAAGAAAVVAALALTAVLLPVDIRSIDLFDPVGAPPPGEKPAPRPDPERSPLGGSALLVAETQPPGAAVLVDGVALGETPLERDDLRDGEREVELRHPHRETKRLPGVAFAAGEVTRIDETLAPATGKLTVVTTPREAWIEHDGERLATGTPTTLEGLPAGPVTLTLGAAEHRTLEVEATVPKEGVARLERRLERIPHGTLTLELVPAEATVVLPDVAARYQPGVRLPEGRHRVEVSAPGHAEAARTVEVKGATQVRIELGPTPPFTVLPEPSAATVRFADDARAYRAGMPLPPGDYQVEVDAAGHEPWAGVVAHGAAPTRHRVALAPLPPFTVLPEPPAATVRFQDGARAYRAGMPLPPGDYQVEVDAAGHEPWAGVVAHGAAPTRHRVALERTRSAFTVVPEPSEATVRFQDGSLVYRAGMPLPWGDYQVMVSAPGYETAERTIRHHAGQATQERVALREKRWMPGYRFRDCAECPEMVVVPAGSFWMGSPRGEAGRDGDEGPRHEVRIAEPFAMGVYEVTFAQWDACAAAGGCGGRRPKDRGWGRGDRPVIFVSWDDAQAYVRWLSEKTGERYRLPSESEWEYAARAGTATRYWWGNGIGGGRANCDGCGSRWDNDRTAPVGSFAANPWACTTCTATSGSGSRTAGTTATRAPRRTARRGRRAAARVAFCAAAPGNSNRGTSAPRSASGSPTASGSSSTASGSECRGRCGRSPLESLPLYLFGGFGGLPPTGVKGATPPWDFFRLFATCGGVQQSTSSRSEKRWSSRSACQPPTNKELRHADSKDSRRRDRRGTHQAHRGQAGGSRCRAHGVGQPRFPVSPDSAPSRQRRRRRQPVGGTHRARSRRSPGGQRQNPYSGASPASPPNAGNRRKRRRSRSHGRPARRLAGGGARPGQGPRARPRLRPEHHRPRPGLAGASGLRRPGHLPHRPCPPDLRTAPAPLAAEPRRRQQPHLSERRSGRGGHGDRIRRLHRDRRDHAALPGVLLGGLRLARRGGRPRRCAR